MNRIFILTTIFVFLTIFVESINLILQLKGRRLIYNHYDSPYNAGEQTFKENVTYFKAR